MKNGSSKSERAMAADGRFGGHIVSGHIDGTGVIQKKIKEGNAVWITIQAKSGYPESNRGKGSICIDGISLTVERAEETADIFCVGDSAYRRGNHAADEADR